MNRLLQAGSDPLFSCDTLVVRSDTAPGRAIFAKNSDRPVDEAQPLQFVPAALHPPGSTVRCQYLTVPQAHRTLAVLGSRPWWLWGFEHGVNEASVAIGNEGIYTRDEPSEHGLLGMDLVRLGLERGATAQEALLVIIDHLERYGQGGNCVNSSTFAARYQNSFIIADPNEAFVLETSARHWVFRKTDKSAAIGNVLTIEDDWTDASDGIETYARQQGWWWGPPTSKLNFRIAFEDDAMRSHTEDRYQASCRFLASGDAACSVPAIMRHLRDHFESGTVHTPETPDAPRPRSICCHPGRFASATAASLIVELSSQNQPPTAWCSMSTPCTSVFLPVEVGAALPPAMVVGGDTEDDFSLWWAMRSLSEIADHDPQTLTPHIQRVWMRWEKELLTSTAADRASVARELNTRVEELLRQRSELVENLAAEALASGRTPPRPTTRM